MIQCCIHTLNLFVITSATKFFCIHDQAL